MNDYPLVPPHTDIVEINGAWAEVPVGNEEYILRELRKGIPDLAPQLARFEDCLGQLARILDAQQRRIDALEKDNAMRITINHQQAKGLQSRIRERAGQICGRYALDERLHGAAIRAAIKKAVLKEWGIRDLHDLPLGCLPQAGEMIAAFADFALIQKRRRIEREGIHHAG